MDRLYKRLSMMLLVSRLRRGRISLMIRRMGSVQLLLPHVQLRAALVPVRLLPLRVLVVPAAALVAQHNLNLNLNLSLSRRSRGRSNRDGA